MGKSNTHDMIHKLKRWFHCYCSLPQRSVSVYTYLCLQHLFPSPLGPTQFLQSVLDFVLLEQRLDRQVLDLLSLTVFVLFFLTVLELVLFFSFAWIVWGKFTNSSSSDIRAYALFTFSCVGLCSSGVSKSFTIGHCLK